MDDYTSIINLISNVGFPIVIAIYLLHGFEKKLDLLIEHIQKLTLTIEKHIVRK
ncbi:MAG: YvrJ family protein [Kurthia sp.]|nr:YvrJ family protein [Candidatus Kurthia equi]